MCQVCALALRQEQHTVATALSPEAALQWLEHETVDLLLTDIAMPSMTGLELARLAQQLQPLMDVVIMTARASYSLLEDALQQGIADFIPKPFDVHELRLTVARALSRQRLRRENVRLATLAHVVEASQAFANSLEQASVAAALSAAVRRETNIDCVHVLLNDGRMFPAASAHSPCRYTDGPLGPALTTDLRAHDAPVGHLVIAATAEQQRWLRDSEVLQLLMKHGALALHNAEMYANLSDLDEQKSEFVALASHELRTPLSVVLGYSALLQNRLEGTQSKYIREIVRASLRLNDLVDDLINLRQLHQREAPLHIERIELVQLLRVLNVHLQRLAAPRAVTLQFRHPRRAIWFEADRERLLLALAQLITNGLRFTPKGGAVTVTAGVQAPTHGGNLVFVIEDTGIGIAPQELSRIFKRFYQVADSRTRQEGGMGIGLPLARTILELHSGSLRVESQAGRGSRFIASLPPSSLVADI